MDQLRRNNEITITEIVLTDSSGEDIAKDAKQKLQASKSAEAKNKHIKVDKAEEKEELVDMGNSKGLVPRSKIKDDEIISLFVKCTVCQTQIQQNKDKNTNVQRHPALGVLLCKECYDFYDRGEFSQDEMGDNYCRWCGQGGSLLGCDFCHNAFCCICIRRSFGRGTLSKLQQLKEWHCFICDPKPLKGMVGFCNLIIDFVKKNQKSEKKKKKFRVTNDIRQPSLIIEEENIKWLKSSINNINKNLETEFKNNSRYKRNLNRLSKKKVNSPEISNKYFKKLQNNLLNFANSLGGVINDMKLKEIHFKNMENSLRESNESPIDSPLPSTLKKQISAPEHQANGLQILPNSIRSLNHVHISSIQVNKEPPFDLDQGLPSLLAQIDSIAEPKSDSEVFSDRKEELNKQTLPSSVDACQKEESNSIIPVHNDEKCNEDAKNKLFHSLNQNLKESNSSSNFNGNSKVVNIIEENGSASLKPKEQKNSNSQVSININHQNPIQKEMPPYNHGLAKKIESKDKIDNEIDDLCKMPSLNIKNNGDKMILDQSSENKEEKPKKPKTNSKGETLEDDQYETESEDESDSENEFDSENGSILKKMARILGETQSMLVTNSVSSDEELSDESIEELSIQKKKSKMKRSNDHLNTSSSSKEFPPKKKSLSHKYLNVALTSDSSNENSDSQTNKKKVGVKRKHQEDTKESVFSDSDSEESDFESKKTKKSKQSIEKDPSSDEEDVPNSQEASVKRKNIRNIFSEDKLTNETKAAAQEEKERRKRLAARQKLYNKVVEKNNEGEQITKKLVLEIDKQTKEELVEINPKLIVNLKPHQVEGVKFIWDCMIESVKRLKETDGSGCVLAHCMGLGKTLQVIVFLHTVLTNPLTKPHLKTALVLCPYNTVLNWAQEFEHWLGISELKLKVFEMAGKKENHSRLSTLDKWRKTGGVMIIGYDMFRIMVTKNNKKPKKFREEFAQALLDPGPDIVVCDEGHILKNINTAIAKAANSINCKRRVILTGTPLQNNLKEYHCMVHFVKPHLLGTKKEFQNRFVNPIVNGQCADSNANDVKLMKKRVHILHSLLNGCVQRHDYHSLSPFLPQKHEYVISIRLSQTQINLYRYFLDNFAQGKKKDSSAGTNLFQDFDTLRQIWTHPFILMLYQRRKATKDKLSEVEESDVSEASGNEESLTSASESGHSNNENDIICLDSSPKRNKNNDSEEEVIKTWKSSRHHSKNTIKQDGASTSSAAGIIQEPPPRVSKSNWWSQFYDQNEGVNPELGGKLMLLIDILQACENIGDKILLFSQSLLILDLIEAVLKFIDDHNEQKPDDIMDKDCIGTWVPGIDYFRMDGATNVDNRKKSIKIFNDESNLRARLFMISTKAGSLGTNLIGANRVIIMDASWNPTHDIQAIFRVYRFGQKKPVYIYRFLAQGTMEEKIYDRQVTKQSLSYRVLDEQQIERHFNASDLQELYNFTPEVTSNRPIPLVPKDLLLAELLINRKEWISTYHEHDSLLENKVEEDLTEEERKTAWQEYEAEKEGLMMSASVGLGGISMVPPHFHMTNPKVITYDEIEALPDAHKDIEKIIKNIKQSKPNLEKHELNSSLMSSLILLRSHQQNCHAHAVRQKQEFLANKTTVPIKLNQYLSALNVSIQQITSVLQNLRNQHQQRQQQQLMFPSAMSHQYNRTQNSFVNTFNKFVPQMEKDQLNQLKQHLSKINRGKDGPTSSFKITVVKVPPGTKAQPTGNSSQPRANAFTKGSSVTKTAFKQTLKPFIQPKPSITKIPIVTISDSPQKPPPSTAAPKPSTIVKPPKSTVVITEIE